MNGSLTGLRANLAKREDELSIAQQDQAKAKNEVMKKEKSIKKQEKALEGKVDRPLILQEATQRPL